MNYIKFVSLIIVVTGIVGFTKYIFTINLQNVNLQNENLHLTQENTAKDALLNDQIIITNAFSKRISKNTDIENNVNKIKYKKADNLLLNELNEILNCNLQNFFNTKVVCQK